MDSQSSLRAFPLFSKVYSYLSWILWADIHICYAIFVSLVHMHLCVCMQMANLADVDAPEEDKINVLIKQSTYESMKWVSSAIHFCPHSTSLHLINQQSPCINIIVFLHLLFFFFSSYNIKPGAGLPANYTCYRCGNTGHHIRNCPTSGVRAEHVRQFLSHKKIIWLEYVFRFSAT